MEGVGLQDSSVEPVSPPQHAKVEGLGVAAVNSSFDSLFEVVV